MFVRWSLTARKGLCIWIYWIIVRVLSSSRPYQALIFQTKANKQIQISDKTFTFIWVISSPPTRLKTGTWGSPANPQLTSHWKFDKIQMKTFTFIQTIFFSFNSQLQLTNWLKIGWFCMKIKGNNFSARYPVSALPESEFQRREQDIPFRHKYLVPVSLNP